MPVAAVVRVLPRDWDGRRLLRFLAGLAMLALAFTAPAAPLPPAEPPAEPPAAVAASETPAESSVTLSEPAPAPQAVRVFTAPVVPEGLTIAALATPPALTGLAQRTRSSRAPPAL
jgi:hypothetical protein